MASGEWGRETVPEKVQRRIEALERLFGMSWDTRRRLRKRIVLGQMSPEGAKDQPVT